MDHRTHAFAARLIALQWNKHRKLIQRMARLSSFFWLRSYQICSGSMDLKDILISLAKLYHYTRFDANSRAVDTDLGYSAICHRKVQQNAALGLIKAEKFCNFSTDIPMKTRLIILIRCWKSETKILIITDHYFAVRAYSNELMDVLIENVRKGFLYKK